MTRHTDLERAIGSAGRDRSFCHEGAVLSSPSGFGEARARAPSWCAGAAFIPSSDYGWVGLGGYRAAKGSYDRARSGVPGVTQGARQWLVRAGRSGA